MIFSGNRKFRPSGRPAAPLWAGLLLPSPLLLALLLLALLLLTLAAVPADARLVKEPASSPADGPDAVFAAIAEAWEIGDEEALAALVHGDGLRVTGGEHDRLTSYSPSQAFYFFKNQFQTHPTVSFRFERLQEKMSGQDRVHGMVVWEYRKAHISTPQEIRLVLVLVLQDGRWRLAEINTISAR